MTVDVAQLKHTVDLLDLVGRDTSLRREASTRGGEYAGPCPFCGGHDRLRVQPEQGLWWCRGCSPDERWQDAIAYLQRRDGIDFREACTRLGAAPAADRLIPRPVLSTLSVTAEPPPAWQDRARTLTADAQAHLWSPVGAKARAYLAEQRGLTEATIRAAQLGYWPAETYEAPPSWGLAEGKRVWLPRGIVLPCLVDGVVWSLMFRRPTGAQKYIQPRGSCLALFGADDLAGQVVAVLTEGEFDCLLLRQVAGDLVDVVTLGSASPAIECRWLWLLRRSARIVATFDRDVAGAKAAAKAPGWSERVRVARPIGAKDLTDMHRAGGDLRAWARTLVGRHGPPSVESAPPAPTPCSPGEPWNAEAARAIVYALGRRVRAAWDATPPTPRPEATYQALKAHDGAIEAAVAAQDLYGVRRAVAQYEQAAAPIAAAYRATRTLAGRTA